MSGIRAHTLTTLREGRVTIVHARPRYDDYGRHLPPSEIIAYVESSREGRPPHVVDRRPDMGWICSCGRARPGTDPRTQCRHVAAVAMVTGHESAATRAGV